jgi:hypothetical protein
MRCVIKGNDWVPFIVKWTSKTITSNGWGEDLGRFGIKYQIFGDSVHESVSAESRSIAFLHYEIIDRSN